MIINKEIMMTSKVKTKEILNQAVADLSVAVSIFHQIHWYMRGRGFFRFHPQMDSFMDSLNDQLDEMAERLIMLGGSPYSTLKEFSEHSKLEEVTGTYDRTMDENLHRVIEIFRYLNDLFKEGLAVTDEEGDIPANDIFTGAHSETEKVIWMLEAERGQAPNLD